MSTELDPAQQVETLRRQQRERWQNGDRCPAEAYLAEHPSLQADPNWILELVYNEVLLREELGETPQLEEYLQRFPQLEQQLPPLFEVHKALESGMLVDSRAVQTVPQGALLDTAVDVTVNRPAAFGRYHLMAKLGSGTFGVVYKAYDADLQRQVAIKVPHPNRFVSPQQAEDYLAEARALARLDHPGIVPVYDVGRTEEGRCYVVSKFIEGSDLAARLQQGRLTQAESVQLIASVAQALHHAHERGLVHRDIKPANILLDSTGRPVVADFGLALRDEDTGLGPALVGTPAYMSPEQTMQEGHRVDARTDVYSLGVILYELLTGERPFRGESLLELMVQIDTSDPQPPSELDATIPQELERICLKALSKRLSDRHGTAQELADDLHHYSIGQARSPRLAGGTVHGVPKGLRAFEAEDADFLLELLPGPRDREGLPESIRFWKKRIEALDAEQAFRVGLLYGPSGCGKSSLVKAGLLPRIAGHVSTVYIEATADATEGRLLEALRKRFPELADQQDLTSTLAALRRGRGRHGGRKILIVFDQFEQWLHANANRPAAELVPALRQCDGEHIQCLLLVRDDFWLAVSRFLRALEIPLVDGQNAALVDLFDPLHARKVLVEFGRAFGRLPNHSTALTAEQGRFLDQAVVGLSEQGKIVPVRLSLFAEMVKGRPWTPATLKEVGGTEGLGVTFLEETFSAASAPPQQRLHRKAARAVLQALLPEPGSDLKGHMRTYQELLAVSGYAGQPETFDELMRLLDVQLRLVTPTDPQETPFGERGAPVAVANNPAQTGSPAVRPLCYQLTHDYLVLALRQWLEREQRSTLRGRAYLRLVQATAWWSARPENRSLPAWWEWAGIGLLTRRHDWTSPQRTLMKKATRYYSRRAFGLMALSGLAGWAGVEVYGRWRAAELLEFIWDQDTAGIPALVTKLGPFRRWANVRLAQVALAEPDDSKKRLHAALALVPVDPSQAPYLADRLLIAEADTLLILRDALQRHSQELTARFWNVLDDKEDKAPRRFRAACALASYDLSNPRWKGAADEVASQLVKEDLFEAGKWTEVLNPVGKWLVPPLARICRSGQGTEAERAARSVAKYAADQPALLTDLIVDVEAGPYQVLLKVLLDEKTAVARLEEKLNESLTGDLRKESPERPAQRRAQAAITLFHLQQPQHLWPLLEHWPDPCARSHLIHRLGPLGVDPQDLFRRFQDEELSSSRQALLLALGRCALSEKAWRPFVSTLLKIYRTEPDPGVHSAVAWLLSSWGPEEFPTPLRQIDRDLIADEPKDGRRWYVTRQGYTMAVIRGPVEFRMGSSDQERTITGFKEQFQHASCIPRSFAVATKPVTIGQFREFRSNSDANKRLLASHPVVEITWFQALEYCNWLSEKEGVSREEWCYPQGDRFEPEMQLSAGYLARTGYRLPTEAEWEYVCRAQTQTGWFFGGSEDLLGEYAWYADNSQSHTHPVGIKMPNPFGLFDIHGNVWEWCQDRRRDYPKELAVDVEDTELVIHAKQDRIFRGGSFQSSPDNMRSSNRNQVTPMETSVARGFRVARTLPQ